MDLGLAGKVAIVAGASRGLGAAAAHVLGTEGARLVIFSRSEEGIEGRADRLRREGVDVVALSADAANPEDLRRVTEAAVNRYGRVDILLTNAGGPPPGSFDEVGDAEWIATFQQNFMSATRLIRECLPHMRKQSWGRIINCTSMGVKQPLENLVLSNAIRSGITAMAKTLAREVARDGITVNNIAPYRILTDRIRELTRARAQRSGRSEEEVMRQTESESVMGRYGTPEEFGALVAFLASTKAAYITGATILLDGGEYRALF